jgi:hypothetical protein
MLGLRSFWVKTPRRLRVRKPESSVRKPESNDKSKDKRPGARRELDSITLDEEIDAALRRGKVSESQAYPTLYWLYPIAP